jgi:hypothetical protein
LGSPLDSVNSGHCIEVPVATQQGQAVLAAERRDPGIIGWNRLSCPAKLKADSRVIVSRTVGNFKNSASANKSFEPTKVTSPVARRSDTVAELSQDDNGYT